MNRISRLLYSPRLLDTAFAIGGIGSAVLLALGPIAHRAPAPLVERPETMGVVLVGVVLAAGLLAIVTARIDRRSADDFVFQCLAKGALAAVYAMLLVSVLWEVLFAAGLGSLPAAANVPVLFLSWAIGYFNARWRGTGA